MGSAGRRQRGGAVGLPRTERPYHHGDLRRALLDAALVLLDEQGVEALSLREVARRAGVSHTAPYRHFEDKDALVAAVAEVSFDELTAAMKTRMAPFEHGSIESLLEAGIGYVDFAVSRPSRFRVIFGPALPRLTGGGAIRELHPELVAAGERCFGVLRGSVAAAQARGLLRDGDTRSVALVAWSTVHGLSSLLVDGQLGLVIGDHAAIETLARGAVTRLLDGLARAPGDAASSARRP